MPQTTDSAATTHDDATNQENAVTAAPTDGTDAEEPLTNIVPVTTLLEQEATIPFVGLTPDTDVRRRFSRIQIKKTLRGPDIPAQDSKRQPVSERLDAAAEGKPDRDCDAEEDQRVACRRQHRSLRCPEVDGPGRCQERRHEFQGRLHGEDDDDSLREPPEGRPRSDDEQHGQQERRLGHKLDREPFERDPWLREQYPGGAVGSRCQQEVVEAVDQHQTAGSH